MSKPTNPVLTTLLPDVDSLVTADSELWSITSHMVVKKGTNVEALLAEMAAGKFDQVKAAMIGTSYTDVTKIR